jgi:N-acetylglucosaminyl-diphospho-decaprenol L-rhamnosyltransferase
MPAWDRCMTEHAAPGGAMMAGRATLDIVIANWNSGELLRRCLASIPDALDDSFTLRHIYVVDNASTDGSADHLEAAAPRLMVTRNPDNRGFARACNQAARQGDADYLLFLNPDTRLDAGSLAMPLRFMASDKGARFGIAGVTQRDPRGRVRRSCARFPTRSGLLAQAVGLDRLFPALWPPHFMVEWDHADSRVVDQVMGAFFLVRRQVFLALDGFDERFFVYYEDVDFALRARQAGWASYHLAEASIHHVGGGTTEHIVGERLFLSMRSRLQYAEKHFGLGFAATLATTILSFGFLARLAYGVQDGATVGTRDVIAAHLKLIRSAPSLLRREGPHRRAAAV